MKNEIKTNVNMLVADIQFKAICDFIKSWKAVGESEDFKDKDKTYLIDCFLSFAETIKNIRDDA